MELSYEGAMGNKSKDPVRINSGTDIEWNNEMVSRELLGAIPDPVVVYDPHGNASYVNKAFVDTYGWTREELLGRRINFVPPEEEESTREVIRRTLAGEKVIFETRRLTQKGELLDIQLRSSILQDKTGKHVASIVIHRDITESKKVEQALRVSEEHYRALLGAIPDAVVVYNPQGEATYINKAFIQTYGWSKQDLLGNPIDFVPTEEEEPTREAWQRTLRGENVIFETRRFTKDGRLLDIQIRTAILQDQEGNHTASIVIHRDVTESRQAKMELEKAHQELEKRVRQRTAELSTLNKKLRQEIEERKSVEESLRESKRRLDLAMEATSDALWDWDLVTNQTYFNPCFYTMLGYEPYELAQSFDVWRNLIHPDDLKLAENKFKQYVKEKFGSFNVEYRLRTKLNEWRWILARGRVVNRDEHGTPVRMIGTHVDITDRKLDEEALRLSEARLREENIRLKSSFKGTNQFSNIIGKSKAMQEIYEIILKAALSNANVIIYGESGTGKELVAQTIHNLSNRGSRKFVTVNCGAIPDNLIESEFFGYKKGAFTGANLDQPGYLDYADGGTLFMDEVGELNLNMQVKLLRAVEGGGYTPIGSRKIKKPDVRIIAATNRDLKNGVRSGRIREDFYYRIHIIPIHLPPVRDRKEDIPLLIHHFLQMYSDEKNIPAVPENIMNAMQNHDWPGNVRELQNAIHRYITLKEIDFPDVPSTVAEEAKEAVENHIVQTRIHFSLRDAINQFEMNYIERLLNENQWHRARVASILGINRRTLFRKMRDLGIK